MAEKKAEKKEESIFPDLKNGALVEAMNALKKDENPQTQGAFVAAATKAAYFAPVDILDADGKPIEGTGKMEIPANAQFNFRLVKNTSGESFFALFTDIPEFQKWNKDEKIKTIVVTFPQMTSLAMKKADAVRGFVINPMGQNLVFTQELLTNLLKFTQSGVKAGEQPQPVKILFGKPMNIPNAVLDSFRKTLSRNSEVNAVYFLMMKQGEQEHYLFVFDTDLDNESAKKIADSFCASARLILTKFPIVSAPLKSPIGESAPKVAEPFYKKA